MRMEHKNGDRKFRSAKFSLITHREEIVDLTFKQSVRCLILGMVENCHLLVKDNTILCLGLICGNNALYLLRFCDEFQMRQRTPKGSVIRSEKTESYTEVLNTWP